MKLPPYLTMPKGHDEVLSSRHNCLALYRLIQIRKYTGSTNVLRSGNILYNNEYRESCLCRKCIFTSMCIS